MRAVIYARYSSDNQRDASIEDQVRVCRALIKREGWHYLIAYSDHAASGASSLRPGYQKLLEDARAGAFEVVVSEALDRLSRDQADTANLYKQLTFLGIQLVTLTEGAISELHVGLKGTMNALYLKDLADKTRRGLEGRVRQGRSGGGLSYGYDVAEESDVRGDPQRGGRHINEAEAAVVRRIFKAYADGLSPRAIAQQLNAEGIPGPHGRPWGPSMIYGNWRRGTGILNNELTSAAWSGTDSVSSKIRPRAGGSPGSIRERFGLSRRRHSCASSRSISGTTSSSARGVCARPLLRASRPAGRRIHAGRAICSLAWSSAAFAAAASRSSAATTLAAPGHARAASATTA